MTDFLELSRMLEGLAKLERAGIVEKTGKLRNGNPVYRFTDFGSELKENYSEDEFDAAVEELVRGMEEKATIKKRPNWAPQQDLPQPHDRSARGKNFEDHPIFQAVRKEIEAKGSAVIDGITYTDFNKFMAATICRLVAVGAVEIKDDGRSMKIRKKRR